MLLTRAQRKTLINFLAAKTTEAISPRALGKPPDRGNSSIRSSPHFRLITATWRRTPSNPRPSSNWTSFAARPSATSGLSAHEITACSNQEATAELQPGLYLVATPIGNLEDITLRALRVLRNANAILAEDTRHSHKLLQYYGITTRTYSFHEHNERDKEEKVLSPQ